MTRMVVQSDAPFLPEEIVTNILKRLPVKSLIRFQCVCKHWKDLFKNPYFIGEHLHHSSVQNPSLLLKHNIRYEPLRLSLVDSEMQVLEVQNPALIGTLPEVRIIGSCNGLLCVAIDEVDISNGSVRLCNSLLLWNPATREVRQIPKTKTVLFPEAECNLGFGFSEIVNDYKIVKTYAESSDMVSGVEVYALSTDSWKEIELGSLDGVRLLGDAVTANGYMFWDGDRGMEHEDENDLDLIVLFDIAREVFSIITNLPLRDDSMSEFFVYEGKFAKLDLTSIGEFSFLHTLIDLWVLEEHIGSSPEKWSWTKKWSSNPCPPMLHLRAIWRNEIVYDDGLHGFRNESEDEMENHQQNLPLYRINTSTNELRMFVVPRCSYPPDIFSHVESLVPVGNIHHEEP